LGVELHWIDAGSKGLAGERIEFPALQLTNTSSGSAPGLAFAVFTLIALAAAFVIRLRAVWARIAVRVAGNWIAATGPLMLGWTVRTR